MRDRARHATSAYMPTIITPSVAEHTNSFMDSTYLDSFDEWESDDDYDCDDDDDTQQPAWCRVSFYYAQLVHDQIVEVLSKVNSDDLDMNGWCYWTDGAYEARDGFVHGTREAYTPHRIDPAAIDVHRQFVIACAYVKARLHRTVQTSTDAQMQLRMLKNAASSWWRHMHSPNEDAYVSPGVLLCALIYYEYVSISYLRALPTESDKPVVVYARARIIT